MQTIGIRKYQKILIGSQEDRNFLRSIIDKIGPIDILIDDGGHTQDQEILSFKNCISILKLGVYTYVKMYTHHT
jgi:hypothetical protein